MVNMKGLQILTFNFTQSQENRQMPKQLWNAISEQYDTQWVDNELVFRQVTGKLDSSPGLFALPHLSVITIEGEDAEKFLQGQLSCDVINTSEAIATLGCCCTPKGRIIGIFHLIRSKVGFTMVMEFEIAETLTTHLSKYIPFFKASIKNQSQDWAVLGFTVKPPEQPPMQISQEQENSSLVMKLGNNRWLILTPAKDLLLNWQQNSERELISSSNDWRYLDIQSKIPAIQKNSIEQFLPHDIGLPEAGGINFKKGCYTGQEIIARMEYRGKLKQHAQIVGCSNSISLKASEKITILQENTKKTIGSWIYSSTNSQGKTIALISLKDSYLDQKEFTLNNEIPTIIKLIE